jgi:O-methyltransferase involved in polyketide biosynthesis
VNEGVNLTGVPETMLWTLHNRASEARRPDGFLRDPDAVRIHAAIAYDYVRSFGRAQQSHAARSRLFDDALRPWLAAHPGGTVVELAAGLETQFKRVDDGRVAWLCVDVPESIAVRERFLPASARCRHIAKSALDLSWLDEVDPRRGVYVTAQGLFMYFHQGDVRRLFTAVVERFAGVELMFDFIPPWISRRTLHGAHLTRHYRLPPMPWGVKPSELERVLRSWSPRVREVSTMPYGILRGPARAIMQLLATVPALRDVAPGIARVTTAA